MRSGEMSSRSGHVAELGRQRGHRGTLLGGSCPEPPRPVPAREQPPCPSSSQGPDCRRPLGLASSGALAHASLPGVPGPVWEVGPRSPTPALPSALEAARELGTLEGASPGLGTGRG